MNDLLRRFQQRFFFFRKDVNINVCISAKGIFLQLKFDIQIYTLRYSNSFTDDRVM